jgi:hypothetical protein
MNGQDYQGIENCRDALSKTVRAEKEGAKIGPTHGSPMRNNTSEILSDKELKG